MFRKFFIIAALLAHTALASHVRSYPDGLKKVGDDKPLVVFCYGANFDRINLEIRDKLFKGKERDLMRVLGRVDYVMVPIFQHPSKTESKEYEKVMGKSRLPGGIWSYPCLAVVDGKGNLRGAVQSAEDLETPQKAAEALSALLEEFYQQQKILKQANGAKDGAHKAKLMREALSFTRVRVPGHGMYDPANNGLGEKLQVMDLVTANAHVRNIIANGNFTLIERQMILVALAGHMRRSGKASTARMRAIYTEIRNIDPTSIYGNYAQGALELWVYPAEGKKPEPRGEVNMEEFRSGANKDK